ncbi:MAG: hypothetical protein JW900_13315 [Anaerolineae bacterium]|nr:hypothetical protein [Anaerolineae bacterium]
MSGRTEGGDSRVVPGPGIEEAGKVPALVELTGRLERAMVPVEPSTAFVRSLGRELIAASRRSQRAARRLRYGLLIGAAALGSAASVAGVVTFLLLRRRGGGHPRPVA